MKEPIGDPAMLPLGRFSDEAPAHLFETNSPHPNANVDEGN
jgi:hypothetical protein